MNGSGSWRVPSTFSEHPLPCQSDPYESARFTAKYSESCRPVAWPKKFLERPLVSDEFVEIRK